DVLRGQRLALDMSSPTFDAPAIGAVPAAQGIPLVAGVATTFAGRTSLLIINKSASASAMLTIRGVSGRIRSVRKLNDNRLFDASQESGGLSWRDLPLPTDSSPQHLTAAAHSLLWIEFGAL